VFLDYVTALGHTLIDCALYLPKEWTDDPDRCREAGIAETVGFRTKCELARLMVERISRAHIPISWVVADTVYGDNLDLRTWLEAQGYFFVLAVACNEPVGIRTQDGRRRQVEVRQVEALLLHDQDWQRLSMGDGTKGPRLFDWACVPILHRWQDDRCHWLLLRRCIEDPKQKAYYFVFGPKGTTLQEMVKAIGARWRIEDDFKTSKAMGLAQYEVRCFIGWYRHMTLVMLAHAFLAVICAQARNAPALDISTSSLACTLSAKDASLPSLLTIAASSASSFLPILSATPLPVSALSSLHSEASAWPSCPVLEAAPLTIPEARHVLATLIWPLSRSVPLVLTWSWWRRCHQGMASYYHTKRPLDAG
jgi:hypothetical protein